MKLFNKWLPPVNLLAIFVLLIISFVSLFAPFLAPYEPNEINMTQRLLEPSGEHLLGTDALGRDVFSRILYGGRTSILLAILASLGTMLIGLLAGIIAGYYGGRLDQAIQVIVNIFQGLPGLSFMLAIAGVLGPGIKSILISVIIVSWADFSRIVRGEVLKIREEPYIEGIRALGAGHLYIIVAHIIPNIIGPFIVLFTVKIGKVVLNIASLSFLGLGLQPPDPDWGVMVNDAKTYFRSHPNLIIAPGLCIMLLCISINLLGDALRDFFDTKQNVFKQYL